MCTQHHLEDKERSYMLNANTNEIQLQLDSSPLWEGLREDCQQ